MEAVQQRPGERRERDEGEIGEGDAEHLHRQRQALGVAVEARGEQQHQPVGAEHPQRRRNGHRQRQVTGHPADEGVQLPSFRGAVFRQHRHERLRKGAFREQAPERVGNAKRHEERIRDAGRAQEVRQHHIPRKPAHAGQRRHGRHHRPLRRQALGCVVSGRR